SMNPRCVSQEAGRRLVLDLPDAEGAVRMDGGKVLAVGGEGVGVGAGVVLKVADGPLADELSRLDVPEAEGRVGPEREELFAVGLEIDGEDVVRVSLERLRHLSRRCVYEADGAVPRATGEGQTVGRPGEAA